MEKIYKIAEEAKKLSIKRSKLSWTKFTTGFDFGIEEANKKNLEFYKDEDNYKEIIKMEDKVEDKVDKRRIEILKNGFEPYHLSDKLNDINLKIQNLTNKLSSVLNNFRFKIDGEKVTSVEIYDILNSSDDRNLRKKAFLSRNQINKKLVDEGFIDLINLRKEFAEEFGANDYVEYKLSRQELSSKIFDNWENEVKDALPEIKKINNKMNKKYLNVEEIKPWDRTYISSQIAPKLNEKVEMSKYYETINSFLNNFGINLDNYNIVYDIFPRKNKSEWGYNFPIETGKDSRILANVKNKFNEYGVLLHESGHGIHFYELDPEEIILNRGVSGIISEGIANLFGSFLLESIFYENIIGDSDEIREQFENIKKWRNIQSVLAIPNILFDQKLYKNEIKNIEDIHDIYWNNYKLLLKKEPYAENPVWGYRIHHTTHPIYLHNYFMGTVTNKMIKQVFCKKHSIEKVTDKPKEFWNFVKDNIIKPSGKYKYNELFKRISGEDFSLKYLKNDIE